MKNKIFVIILSILMVVTSIHATTINAQAVFTSSAGVYESMMFLMGLLGLKVNQEINSNKLNLSTFEASLKDYSLDLYYWFQETAYRISAGNKIVGLDAEKQKEFREWCQLQGWNAYDTRYTIGTQEKNFEVFTSHSWEWNGEVQYQPVNIKVTGIPYEDGYNIFVAQKKNTFGGICAYRMYFVPVSPYYDNQNLTDISSVQITYTNKNEGDIDYSNLFTKELYNFDSGKSCLVLQFGWGQTYNDRTLDFTMAGYTFLTLNASTTSNPFPYYTINPYLKSYYANGGITENLTVEVMQGENDTAVGLDQAVVGSGTLAREDENNGDVVVEGTPLANLANIDVQALLKQIADNQIDYQTLLQSVGLTLVNTQEKTVEQVEAIAKAQSIAQAGVNTITGDYTVDLTSFFPFCIPFDLYRLVQAFNAPAQAPTVTISLPVGYNGNSFTWQDYSISLEPFNTVAQTVRIFEYILFLIGLMLITRKLIEG